MSFDYGACLLRLTEVERQKLQLVVAGLRVSEYTDDVDDARNPVSKAKRIVRALYDLFDTITGLAVASEAISKTLKDGLLSGDTSIAIVVPLLEDLFEVMRRHKRLNPFEHRGEYGKLLMVLQDVQKSSVQQALGIRSGLVVPCQTVGSALEAVKCTQLLEDHDFLQEYLRKKGAEKRKGMELLVARYGGDDAQRRAVIERCLYSADDVRQFILSNISPLKELFGYVRDEFEPMSATDKYSLNIQSGRSGACFTHQHLTHCQYVEESLKLWEIVQRRIFSIWEAAEDDMVVDGHGRYDFVNTGQGFHRMCVAPKSYKAMAGCVHYAEDVMRGWVGIKVIHLGDVDVPNPLVFIDKYTVIPRIVQPIVTTLRQLQRIFGEQNEEDAQHAGGESISYPGIQNLLRAKYRSYEELRMLILCDFFKHAFDGSGDDGGTCIDGRLTSAWNWCHQLNKKTYYDAFVLTGFTGFD